MRILTVRQPWAWAIIHGGKDIENRSRSLGPYRGPVAIHAGLRYADDWQSDVLATLMNGHPGVYDEPQPWRANAGEIIGVVDLVDAHRPQWDHTCSGHDGACSSWGEVEGWPHHLVLANPRALDEPIPWKGGLGLRKTDLDIIGDHLVAPWGHGPSSCTPYGCEPGCEFEPVARLVATS